MAEQILTNVQIFIGSFDFSGHGNALEMNYGAELLDVTPFNLGYRKRIPGMENFEGSLQGFLNDAATTHVDEAIEAELGGTGHPLSVSFGTGTVGDAAYFCNSVHGDYSIGGGVGEAGVFSLNFATRQPGARLVDGYVLDSGSKTATGNASAVQVGAIDNTNSAEVMYAALHCTAWDSLTSVDVVVASDDDSGFASGTTRITFTQLTDVGYEFSTLASDVTDDWWRSEITVVGSGSATLFLTVGIRS